MTDTAKLRAGIVYTGGPYTVTLDVDATESLMRQAADEIEELRRKLRDGPQTLNAKWLDHRCWDGCQSLVFERQIEELRRENAELRNEPKNSKRKWKMPLP